MSKDELSLLRKFFGKVSYVAENEDGFFKNADSQIERIIELVKETQQELRRR